MAVLCPGCATLNSDETSYCEHCRLPFGWIAGFPQFQDGLRRAAVNVENEPRTGTAPTIVSAGVSIAFKRQQLTTLGRASSPPVSISLADPSIESTHVLIAPWREDLTGEATALPRFFLVDGGSRIGTFVNRRRVAATELRGGDLLQIGPFAWSFSAADGHLVPLTPIHGIGLQLDSLHVADRLGPDFRLTIEPGSFVAIVGGSGAGKSTLVKVLSGQPGLVATGRVTVLESEDSGWDRAEHVERFREALGYVSQDSILHEELNARQILTTSGLLRGEAASANIVESALMRAEIDREGWDRPVRSLSGGQNKRVRVASELMGQPRLLLLDEPDSGLDADRRASLMRMLRSLSWQGCTVVLVTHVVGDLEQFCDRVVEIRKGMVHRDLGLVAVSASLSSALPSSNKTGAVARANGSRQLGILIGREVELMRADWLRRLMLPAVVAALFAVSLGVAVDRTHVPLLGFLAIVSVLWMSASSSLLAIAGERAVFDHERQLFLSVPSYLFAKFLAFAAVVGVQTLLFVAALGIVRWLVSGEMLSRPIWATGVLLVTGTAGVALGLCLSALAGRRKESATFLLPLVMIAQLVFSVPVACPDAARDSVNSAYAKFHPRESNVCLAACASYLTISRPADLALRSFSYHPPDDSPDGKTNHGRWGLLELVAWAAGLLLFTVWWLVRLPFVLSMRAINRSLPTTNGTIPA